MNIQLHNFIVTFLQNEFKYLEPLNVDIKCGLNGPYGDFAEVLDDLVTIIQEVGIEQLSEELGVNLDLFISL